MALCRETGRGGGAHWAIVVGRIFLALGFASAFVILVDQLLLGHRQQMWIMNLVHPITALYLGPVWVWAYLRHNRKSQPVTGG